MSAAEEEEAPGSGEVFSNGVSDFLCCYCINLNVNVSNSYSSSPDCSAPSSSVTEVYKDKRAGAGTCCCCLLQRIFSAGQPFKRGKEEYELDTLTLRFIQ